MPEVQVAALGNAIVDVLAKVDDGFVAQHGIPRGGFMLIGPPQAEEILAGFSAPAMVAGGSAGNTLACLASFGGKARFIGKVADDELGEAYRSSMRGIGVSFDTPAGRDGLPTGRCLVAITPDAERSMATLLGIASHFTVEDLQPGDVEDAQVCFLEGYMFEDEEITRKTVLEAAERAKNSGRFTAMTLADPGLVQRVHGPLSDFLKNKIDIVFANEEEAKMLTGKDDPREAAEAIREFGLWGAVTMSEKGSWVFGPDGGIERVDAIEPKQLLDSTGAGDAYAAGWLYGFTTSTPIADCGRLGSLAAAEVISHAGARPEVSLARLARDTGLLR